MGEELTQPRLLKPCATFSWGDLLLIFPEKVSHGHALEVSDRGRKLSSVDLPLLIPRPLSRIGSGGECLCEWWEAVSTDLHLPGRTALADGRHIHFPSS